jgi:hypothetical protein
MISSTVSTTVAVDKVIAFSHVVPIDLASIFTGYGLLPAVIGTQAQTGDWDEIGQTRTVHLADGSHAQECLTQYREPNYFAYVVSDFAGALGFLVASATGEWWFESGTETIDRTLIRWKYTFIPKFWFAVPILWSVNKFLWYGYMRSVMSNVKLDLDNKVIK